MPYLTWMADVLRAAGLPVREVSGWKTRGHGSFATGGPLGVLAHHTAGPASGAYPSESVVVNGRPDLAGPLANLGLDRNGTWIVIAAGSAWHAGTGSISWCPKNQGNSYLIGVEAESVGTRDDWTPAQRANYPRGVAALLRYLRLPASRAIGHKEWAPGRKVDPAFWDMNAFRADVAHWLAAPTASTAREGFLDMLSDQEQAELLSRVRNLDFQLFAGEGGPDGRPGWRTWPGGTNETLTVVDLLRRNNVEVRALRAAVDALAAAVAHGSGGTVTADEIHAAVHDAIAQGLVEVDVVVRGQQAPAA